MVCQADEEVRVPPMKVKKDVSKVAHPYIFIP